MNIYWESPGGIANIDRDDIRRATHRSHDEGKAGKAPRHSMAAAMEGASFIPAAVRCDRLCVRTSHEARYVTQMSDYLFGKEGPLPVAGPPLWVAEYGPFRASGARVPGWWYRQHRFAFYLSRKAGRVITNDDWEALRVDRSELRKDTVDLDADVDSLLSVPLSEFPSLPSLVGRLKMPARIPIVIPPVLRFFASDVSRSLASMAEERYFAALEAEVKRGVLEVLGDKRYWTGRVLRLDAMLMNQLQDWDNEGCPILEVIDRPNADPLHPRELLRHARMVEEASDSQLLTRRDSLTGEGLTWALAGSNREFL